MSCFFFFPFCSYSHFFFLSLSLSLFSPWLFKSLPLRCVSFPLLSCLLRSYTALKGLFITLFSFKTPTYILFTYFFFFYLFPLYFVVFFFRFFSSFFFFRS